jgi:hypothetical protein
MQLTPKNGMVTRNIFPGFAPVTAAATKKHRPPAARAAEDEVDDHHHAEVTGVDAVNLGGDGQQDRHRHDEAGNAVDHRADDQQDDVG